MTARGLLASKSYGDAIPVITGLTVGITNGSPTVTSAGLFVPAHEKRYFTVSSSGIPSETWIETYVDANTVTLNQNATATGSRTATLDGYVFLFMNQGTPTPVSAPIHAELTLPDFLTGTTGLVKCVLTAPIKVWLSGPADSYHEWGLLDNTDTMLLPNSPGGQGSRIQHSNTIQHPPKFERELTLLPNTTYSGTQFGAASGNQVPATPDLNGWIVVIGGTYGAATMEIWDLDDGTGPQIITATPGLLILAGVAASVTLGTVTLDATPGLLVLAGIAASLTASNTIAASAGVLVIAGVAPTIDLEGTITADPGLLVLEGVAATIDGTEVVAATAGALILTGVTPNVARPLFAAIRAPGDRSHLRAPGRP